MIEQSVLIIHTKSMLYLTIKALHIIAVVAWFAGLFYIFRLFVYHVKYQARAGVPETMQEMERKLLKIITIPASLVALGAGLTMLHLNPGLMQQGWFWVKAVFVVLLFAYQHLAQRTLKRFAKGDYYLSEKSCRMINEVPTLVLFVAVLMAILKPF